MFLAGGLLVVAALVVFRLPRPRLRLIVALGLAIGLIGFGAFVRAPLNNPFGVRLPGVNWLPAQLPYQDRTFSQVDGRCEGDVPDRYSPLHEMGQVSGVLVSSLPVVAPPDAIGSAAIWVVVSPDCYVGYQLLGGP